MSPASANRQPAAEQPAVEAALEVRLIAGDWAADAVAEGGVWRAEAEAGGEATAEELLATLPLRRTRDFGSGLLPAAAGDRDAGPAWFAEGVLITVAAASEGRWRVHFEDLAGGAVATAEVAGRAPAVVAYPRRADGRAVAVALLPATQAPAPTPWAASLRTDRFTARSREGRWRQEADGTVRMRRVEVAIPRPGEGAWLLRADEVEYAPAAEELTARRAELFDATGVRLASGELVLGFRDGTVEIRERR